MILISINHFYEVFLFVYKMKYKLMIIYFFINHIISITIFNILFQFTIIHWVIIFVNVLSES